MARQAVQAYGIVSCAACDRERAVLFFVPCFKLFLFRTCCPLNKQLMICASAVLITRHTHFKVTIIYLYVPTFIDVTWIVTGAHRLRLHTRGADCIASLPQPTVHPGHSFIQYKAKMSERGVLISLSQTVSPQVTRPLQTSFSTLDFLPSSGLTPWFLARNRFF